MHPFRITLSITLVSLLCSCGAFAQFPREDPELQSTLHLLETWIGAQMESRGIPGLAIAVVYDQEPVYTRGFGLADLEKKTPVTPQTVFRIASITKTFTATAVMILRDRGKLQLDDPVAKYLPWFSYKNRFPEGPVVTIRQLLTHTSGLPRESSFPYWTDYKFPTRDEMIKALASQESIFEPETKLKYSNLGIAILGEVVAAVAGEPYDAFITKEILKPLGMASTSVFPTAAQGGRFATGYGRRFPDGRRDKSPFMDSKGITPAANISSTVEDMAKYASFHLTEGRKPGSSVLKPSTLREMHRVHWLNSSWEGGWGLGFSVNKGSERTTYGHGGWVGGNRSQLLISPKEKVGVIVMVNADDGIPSFFASRAMNMLAPVLSRLGTKPEKEVPADSSWSKYVGLYTDPSGWDTEILIRKGKLMMYGYSYPPEENPINSLVELTPEGKDTFRMTGDGGSGELVVFEMGPDGKVVRVKAEENYMYPKK